MLYPIVEVETEELHGTVCVSWYRNTQTQRQGVASLAAHEEGVFVGVGWLYEPDEVSEHLKAVRDAWDAVRAIRHGTSLERFPRDLTTVSQQTEDAQ